MCEILVRCFRYTQNILILWNGILIVDKWFCIKNTIDRYYRNIHSSEKMIILRIMVRARSEMNIHPISLMFCKKLYFIFYFQEGYLERKRGSVIIAASKQAKATLNFIIYRHKVMGFSTFYP